MTTIASSTQGWAWVRAAQAGDRDAFGRLYQHYRPDITRFLRSRLPGDPHLVEDLCAETFLRAWRRIDSASDDRGAQVGTWLTTIARNLVTDHYKSARARYEVVVEAPPEPGRPEELSDTEAGVLDRFGRDAAAVTVAAALAALIPPQRRAVELYDLAGNRDIAGAAERMGRTVAAVRALRQRGIRSMADQLVANGLTSRAGCVEAVGQARETVRHAVAVARLAGRAA